MLLIIAPEKKYINNLVEKFDYTKKGIINKVGIYNCTYNNHQFLIATTGYGKVNITNALRYLCDNYDIKVIVQIGTAGSISDANDIFNAVVFCNSLQYDVDFSPLGYSPSIFPNELCGIYPTNNDLRECMQRSCITCGVNYTNDLIASGDMFVCNNNLANSIRREYNAGAVDVESAVLGQFAYQNNIAYVGVKVISNFAYNNSVKQYKLYEEEAISISEKIASKFIKNYYD